MINNSKHKNNKILNPKYSQKNIDNAQKIIFEYLSNITDDLKEFLEILNNIDAAIYISDINTYEVLFVNKYLLTRKGNIVGKLCWKVLQKDKRGPCEFCTNYKLLDNSGFPTGVYQWEFQNTISKKWYYLSDQVISWHDGRTVRMEVAYDITNRKKHEFQMQQNEKYLQTIVDIQNLLVNKNDSAGTYSNILKILCEIINANRAYIYKNQYELKKKPVTLLHSEYNNNSESIGRNENLKKILLSNKSIKYLGKQFNSEGIFKGNTSGIPGEILKILGTIKPASFIIIRLMVENKVWGIIGIDVSRKTREWTESEISLLKATANAITAYESTKTAIKQTEESEKNLSVLVDSIPLGVVVHTSGIIQYINPAAVKIGGGTSNKDFIGKSVLSMVHPDYVQVVAERMHQVYSKDGNVDTMEEKFIQLDGTVIDVDVIASIVNFRGKPSSQVVINDITERKRTELALKESESKYRHLIQHSNDAIYVLVENKFEIINDKFIEIFGVTLEDVQKSDFDFMNLVAPKSRMLILERTRRVLQGEKLSPNYEFTALSKNGTEIEIEASVSYIDYDGIVATQGILRDITERKLIEAQLIQSQKMEAIGTLAGGVAHDFNNLLTVINGHAEISLMKMDKSNKLFNSISNILSAGKRAEKLTSQLLAFSRKQIYDPKIIEINPIILHLEKMLERIIGEDIKIRKKLATNLPTIKADPTQIEQILMNLVVNAADAIRENPDPSSKRTIMVETTLQKDKEAANNKKFIQIKVIDTGMGFPREIRDKIFEPFFTTKELGKGTGLGLATVYGIIKQNNGNINIQSIQGKGTTVTVYWPTSEGYLNESSSIEIDSIIIRGKGKILIVEDDDNVRDFSEYALKHMGYEIYTAPNGLDALQMVNEKKLKLDLLFTDMIMPGIDGKELMKRIQKIHPKIKVLISSGYTDDFIVKDGMLEENINFIQKPFSIKNLANKIKEILD